MLSKDLNFGLAFINDTNNISSHRGRQGVKASTSDVERCDVGGSTGLDHREAKSHLYLSASFSCTLIRYPNTHICQCHPYQGLHLSSHGRMYRCMEYFKRCVQSHNGMTIPASPIQQKVLLIGQLHHLSNTGHCHCSRGPPACSNSCTHFHHKMDD